MSEPSRSTLPAGPSRSASEHIAEFEAMYRGGRQPFDYDERAIEGLRHDRVAAVARRLAAVGPILDLGCGLGHITARLLGAGADRAAQGTAANPVGMDLSPTAVARARARLSEAGDAPSLLAGSALDLPFRDGSFGLVVASDGLVSWHLNAEQRAAALREIVRVLEPGGHALLTEYLRPRQWPDFVAEVERGGLDVVRVEGIHDRPAYWFESWIKAIRGTRVGRALRRNRRLARVLMGVGRLLGDRACRHALLIARVGVRAA